jgi:hypothetical protein
MKSKSSFKAMWCQYGDRQIGLFDINIAKMNKLAVQIMEKRKTQ